MRFDKVLVANRGAIACRVMRTLQRMGIGAVAVYSEADADAVHVAMAQQSVCVGEAAVAGSYLAMQRIVDAALATGAQAVHPGYGFLSENAAFVELCEAAGLVFLGPTAQQMRLFGLKHTARALATTSGVPLLPGTGLLTDLAQALHEAERIGYPVMLKSSAGGGGIGMQMCSGEADLRAAFDSVRRLAQANFSDGGVFLERYIANARHIEVQVFGDGAGGVLALGERDCSLQRRNQKVVEETPAPNLRPAVRDALLATARQLAAAAHYRSAGTVEFVVDAATQEFFFLEVNARLQVEHGVTEAVTGIDIVEWMLRLGAGELPLLASLVVTPRGHAVQARLYAEDPAKNFQPCTGVLTEVQFPADLRVDTWIERGTEVTSHYDPMLAKLIAHGSDRAEALAKLDAALAATRVAGVESNLGYLRALMSFAPFTEGRHTTRSLAGFVASSRAFDVASPGVQTMVQDWPGRLGHWDVGVPPSGPMDARALRLANRLVGKPYGLAAPKVLAGRTAPFTFRLVESTVEDRVLTLAINRPDALNALNEEVMKQLDQAFDAAAARTDVDTIVIAGKGKAFIAGADIRYFVKRIESKKIDEIVAFTRKGHETLLKFAKARQPVIALLDGLSLGGGSELALACDYIVATKKGSFGFPETGIGIYPGLGGTQRLSRRIGVPLAKSFIYTGNGIGVEAAAKMGLVDRLVDHDHVGAAVKELTAKGKPGVRKTPTAVPAGFEKIAAPFAAKSVDAILGGAAGADADEQKQLDRVRQKAPVALRIAEKLIDASAVNTLADGVEAELAHLTQIFATADAYEGLSTLGKSKPVFKGA